MPRVAFTLLLVVLLVAVGKTAQSLISNGDTGMIIVQTAVCVALLTGAVLCKNVRRAGAD
jgi:low affinity Fe/Cu permease